MGRSGTIEPSWARDWRRPSGPLGGEQARLPHQPQHPLAAHRHVVLVPQPGGQLAVALAAQRRGDDGLADEDEQPLVAERRFRAPPFRARPTPRAPRPSCVDRRAGAASTRETTARGAPSCRFTSAASGRDLKRPFSGRRVQDPRFRKVSSPILRSASFKPSISGSVPASSSAPRRPRR